MLLYADNNLSWLLCTFKLHINYINPSWVNKQDEQCTYKRNFEERSRNHVLPWKSNKYYVFWVCACDVTYPACKAHAPYNIVMCGQSGYIIFFHTDSQTTQFSENVIEHKMCVFIFYINFVRKVSHSRKIQGGIIINVFRCLCKVHFILFGF